MGKNKKQTYFIKEVAELTGLSEQLIRKWESRHQIIQPERLDNGYRIYTTNDLLTLKELKTLRDEGHSMKEAIKIIAATKSSSDLKAKLSLVEPSTYVAQLVDRGTVYDEDGLMLLLNQANHLYGLDAFLANTVQPFLIKIGELWEASTWDESQETVSSLVVKDFLTQISRNFANDAEAPHAIGFCLPDEHHEIPLQILLLQMEMRGWRTTRIGSSPKFSAIETLIDHMQPKKVVLSASTSLPFQKHDNLLEDLDLLAKNNPHIDFYIGGKGVWDYTQIVKPQYMTISYSINDIVEEFI